MLLVRLRSLRRYILHTLKEAALSAVESDTSGDLVVSAVTGLVQSVSRSVENDAAVSQALAAVANTALRRAAAAVNDVDAVPLTVAVLDRVGQVAADPRVVAKLGDTTCQVMSMAGQIGSNQEVPFAHAMATPTPTPFCPAPASVYVTN